MVLVVAEWLILVQTLELRNKQRSKRDKEAEREERKRGKKILKNNI